MLFKVVVFLAIVGLLYLFFTGRIGFLAKSKNKKLESTDMVECEKCGAYVAEKDALYVNGKSYCSESCCDAL